MTSNEMFAPPTSRRYENNSWLPKRDHRTESWFLVESPTGLLIVSAAYWYFVNVAGPRYMAGRKPFSLTRLLLAYNFVASALSAYFGCRFIELAYWDCGYHIFQDVDLSQRRCTLEILRLSWWYLLFRVFEMSDTVSFVLRKKTAQVSGLHVFHHLIVPWDMWLNINYALQPMCTFSTALNCFIHVVMYTYYFIAALGARYRKFLWWKKYITTLQIAQFIANILACLFALCTTGDYPKLFVCIGIVQYAIFFAWFLSFYINVYKRCCACLFYMCACLGLNHAKTDASYFCHSCALFARKRSQTLLTFISLLVGIFCSTRSLW